MSNKLDAEPVHIGQALGALRRARGPTQQQVARLLEMTQPEVSKLERRRDVRVSTPRAYVGAGSTTIARSRATTSKSRLSRVSTRPPLRSAQATTDASAKPSGRSS